MRGGTWPIKKRVVISVSIATELKIMRRTWRLGVESAEDGIRCEKGRLPVLKNYGFIRILWIFEP